MEDSKQWIGNSKYDKMVVCYPSVGGGEEYMAFDAKTGNWKKLGSLDYATLSREGYDVMNIKYLDELYE
jgi:hypothetical protein